MREDPHARGSEYKARKTFFLPMVFVDNKKFYDYLMRTNKEFIAEEPQIKDELEEYLHQIKMELNI